MKLGNFLKLATLEELTELATSTLQLELQPKL